MPEKLIANYQKARIASLVGAIALYVLGTSCIATLLIYLIAVFQIGGTAEHLFRALIPICSLLSISISVIMLAEFFRHFFTDYSPFDTSSWLSLDFEAPFGQVRALFIRLSNCVRACMEESWKNRDAGSQDGETRPSPAQNTFDTAATASFLASRLTCV